MDFDIGAGEACSELAATGGFQFFDQIRDWAKGKCPADFVAAEVATFVEFCEVVHGRLIGSAMRLPAPGVLPTLFLNARLKAASDW